MVAVGMALLSARALFAYYPSPTDWRNENIYQIYTDRFFDGDPSNDYAETNRGFAYAPADPRGIHGGDLRGIQQKLDYIQSLGATAIWISPLPLNDVNGDSSGYRAQDFYQLAPHLGTLTDLSNMVAAAHARGIKVVLDIVVNHTGNFIYSTDSGYPNFLYPPNGYHMSYINPSNQPAPPFNITNVTPAAFTTLYHTNGYIQNFGDGTQITKGEISGLDDLATETTYVRTNLMNIYEYWIQTGDFDGFRIDTVPEVEHGNSGFWNYWCPQIHNFATSLGKSNFFMFGEVFNSSDPYVGNYTGTKGSTNFALDATLDYPLFFTIDPVFANANAEDQQIENHYNAIASDYDPAAWFRLVTFLDNHDNPRFLSSGNANNDTNHLALALGFLYTARGIPCLYYGTEQAFNGGNDPYNREDMFAGQFESGPSVGDNFNETHPLFERVAMLNNLRRNYVALRLGSHVNQWSSSGGPGLFAYSRVFQTQEVFVVFTPAAVSQTLPARTTTYAPGTQLVNLLNTNEVISIDSSNNTPPITCASFEIKIFVAQSQFHPLDPVVVTQSPAHAAANVSNVGPIVLHFSKPMNTNTVQSAFSLQPPTAGTFTWSALGDTMTFTASGVAGFPLSTTNTVNLGTNAVDAVDGNSFYAPFETYFVTGPTQMSTNDTVGDGIPDWWRQQYFGGSGATTNVPGSCATCDADGTGQNNLFKYLAGLDPTNPASVFCLLSLVPEKAGFLATWSCVGGHDYALQATTGSGDGSYSNMFADVSPVIVVPLGGGPSTNYLDLVGSAADNASDPVYSGLGNINGLNGGNGYTAWTASPVTNSSQSGWFVGSSTNNAGGHTGGIDSAGGKSWGGFANNGAVASATRLLASGPMAVGQTFSMDMDNGFVESGGTVGFGLQNASGQNLVQVYYVGNDSSNSYKSADSTGQHNLGVPWTADGLHLQIILLTAGTYSGTLTPVGGSPVSFSGALLNPSGGQGIALVRLFNANSAASNSGPQYDTLWNNMTVSVVTNTSTRYYRVRLAP